MLVPGSVTNSRGVLRGRRGNLRGQNAEAKVWACGLRSRGCGSKVCIHLSFYDTLRPDNAPKTAGNQKIRSGGIVELGPVPENLPSRGMSHGSRQASTLHALIYFRSVPLVLRNASARSSHLLRKRRACRLSSE